MKLTVKLSKPGIELAGLIKARHGLIEVENWGGIEGATLLYGTSYAGRPKWFQFISSGAGQELPSASNQGVSCLLFIPIEDRLMIFIFGYGNQKLSGENLERDFGIKVVLNVIDHNKIKSVDAKKIDNVVTNTRTQLSKEDRIEGFGFQINKDFLKYLSGKPTTSSFAKMVSGGDSLSLNCDVTVATVREKAEEIFAGYMSERYRTHYSWVDNVRSIRDKALIADLKNRLVTAVNSFITTGVTEGQLEIAIPDLIDFSVVDYFKFKGFRSETEYDSIDIQLLRNEFESNDVTAVDFSDLTRYSVDSFGSGGQSTGSWNIYNCLIFESTVEGRQYILSDGEWFEISQSYLTEVNEAFNGITSGSEFLRLTDTDSGNERDYLDTYAVSADEIILDSNLSRVYGGNDPIEICDIYNSSREFIHVKDGSASSKLSHLFNQAYVSGVSFLTTRVFREDLREKLSSNAALQRTIVDPIDPYSFYVVLRILKPGNRFSLPFFSKVVLKEMYFKIKSMGFRFRLEWVKKNSR